MSVDRKEPAVSPLKSGKPQAIKLFLTKGIINHEK
jgi:hypothetical protein